MMASGQEETQMLLFLPERLRHLTWSSVVSESSAVFPAASTSQLPGTSLGVKGGAGWVRCESGLFVQEIKDSVCKC